MVKLGLISDIKHQLLQWDGAKVPMKEPSSMLGKSILTSREIHEVVIQTEEPITKRETTER